MANPVVDHATPGTANDTSSAVTSCGTPDPMSASNIFAGCRRSGIKLGVVSKKVSTLGAQGRCNGGILSLLCSSIRGKAQKRLDRWRETAWKGAKARGGARRRVKERENVWTATKAEEIRARSLLPLDSI
ncbi:unnamed protein product [Euphydryas editha]|uniref:Uncharacterized protein n=1 Tax=Euphydryas editha TaxID=104508 RepID=A0AAU9U9Q1_EUPED|nr:unnamed protein product [Euphydryas editha]